MSDVIFEDIASERNSLYKGRTKARCPRKNKKIGKKIIPRGNDLQNDRKYQGEKQQIFITQNYKKQKATTQIFLEAYLIN